MANWPTLFIIKQFFEPLACDALVAELRSLDGSAATIYGRATSGSIDQNVRRTLRVEPSDETIELVKRRLWSCKEVVEKYFEVALNECEEPQFLHYREGDFFVRHQDGNTEQMEFDHLQVRRISIVVFLNGYSDEPELDTFAGGQLNFYDKDHQSRPEPLIFSLKGEPGLLVGFSAHMLHEVKPVVRGNRFTIISWFR